MAREPGSSSEPPHGSSEVMASIDLDGQEPRLIIADISADNAWLSVKNTNAKQLVDWR